MTKEQRYQYLDADGNLVAVVISDTTHRRLVLCTNGGEALQSAIEPVPPEVPLYALTKYLPATNKPYLVFVDSEADVHVMNPLGIPVTTRPHHPNTQIPDSVFEPFAGIPLVLLPRNTHQSRDMMQLVAQAAYGTMMPVKTVTLPDLPANEPVSHWFTRHGHTKDDLDALIGTAPAYLPGGLIFQPLTAAEVVAAQGKAMLVEHLIGLGDIAMIFGEPNVGKSFVTLDLLASVTLGRTWAGDLFTVPMPRPTIYCTEEGRASIPLRLQALASHYGVTVDELMSSLTVFTRMPQLFNEEETNQFIRDIQTLRLPPPGLIILDTFLDCITDGDENSATDMRKVFANTVKITTAFNCAVIYVHHPNKQGDTERGSGAIKAKLDLMLHVEKQMAGQGQASGFPKKPAASQSQPSAGASPVVYEVSCTKMRDGKAFDPIYYTLIDCGPSAVVEWK